MLSPMKNKKQEKCPSSNNMGTANLDRDGVREGCSEEATFVLRPQGQAGGSEVRSEDKVVPVWDLG